MYAYRIHDRTAWIAMLYLGILNVFFILAWRQVVCHHGPRIRGQNGDKVGTIINYTYAFINMQKKVFSQLKIKPDSLKQLNCAL